MSARAPRFEVVRTDAGWHARFRATNGRVVWVTETYKRRGKAVAAVELICGRGVYVTPFNDSPEVQWAGDPEWPTEVRVLDERAEVAR